MRVSASRAFLRPNHNRPNLETRQVGYLVCNGNRAFGVRAETGGRVTDHFASREVILSLGSLETPMLLEPSGLGDPKVLAEAGVELLVASPPRIVDASVFPHTIARDCNAQR